MKTWLRKLKGVTLCGFFLMLSIGCQKNNTEYKSVEDYNSIITAHYKTKIKECIAACSEMKLSENSQELIQNFKRAK